MPVPALAFVLSTTTLQAFFLNRPQRYEKFLKLVTSIHTEMPTSFNIFYPSQPARTPTMNTYIPQKRARRTIFTCIFFLSALPHNFFFVILQAEF